MAELPVRFKERMRELLAEEYEAFEASYDKERVQGLRFSSLKVQRGLLHGWEEQGAGDLAALTEQRAGFVLEKIPWVKEGYYYGPGSRPGKHPYHEAGLYYIQEPSAMAVVELLDPRPGERILDLCAAPGGKSSHIASRLKGQGFLLSNEIHPARAKVLSQNMERMGVENCVVSNEDPARLVPYFTGFFHRIVVDAPCSGEGMFRKDEAAREQWSEEHVAMCAVRQGTILDHAASMLRPEGRLVYSTCTFAPEENEITILHFLERHRDFCVEHVAAYEGFTKGKPQWAGPEGEALGKQYEIDSTFRIMPHKLEGEGHYMAVLKKSREHSAGRGQVQTKEAAYISGRKREGMFKDYEELLKDVLVEPGRFLEREEYVLFGEQLYLLPPGMPDFTGLRILRPGLHMGTLKKKRFEPSHGLALALRKEDVKRWVELPSEGKQVVRYLKGETLAWEDMVWEGEAMANGPEMAGGIAKTGGTVMAGEAAKTGGTHMAGGSLKGWGLVLTDGLSLGWCKFAGGMIKNHYPKGLRWM